MQLQGLHGPHAASPRACVELGAHIEIGVHLELGVLGTGPLCPCVNPPLLPKAYLLYEGVSCNATRDTIGTCWPHSPAGMMVLLPCPESFNGLRYDSSSDVFRECLASGMWAQRSNYSFCLPIIESKKNSYYYNVAQIINYVGHCISLIALVMAFVIFWCLR
uniref:G-protein coupled receptors family 2 profile 1 domain-containing protein n=1 Tax=Eptatretus burgeri TaxID=7764 RepID=A0A8C4WX01_EPTBU